MMAVRGERRNVGLKIRNVGVEKIQFEVDVTESVLVLGKEGGKSMVDLLSNNKG